MPIYEYRCPSCGHDFEKLQKMSAAPPACPECGFEEVKKKVSASAFVLKGSGWYRDHYGLKKSSGSDGASSGSEASSTSSETSSSGSDSSTSSSGGGSSSSSSTSSAAASDS